MVPALISICKHCEAGAIFIISKENRTHTAKLQSRFPEIICLKQKYRIALKKRRAVYLPCAIPLHVFYVTFYIITYISNICHTLRPLSQ